MENQKSKKTLIFIVAIVILLHVAFWSFIVWVYFKVLPPIHERGRSQRETVAVALPDENEAMIESSPIFMAQPEAVTEWPDEAAPIPAKTADSVRQPNARAGRTDEPVIVTADDLSENQKKVIAYVEEVRGLTATEPLQIVFMTRD